MDSPFNFFKNGNISLLSFITQMEPNFPRPSTSIICTSLHLNSGKLSRRLGLLARDGSLKDAAIFVRQLQMLNYSDYWRETLIKGQRSRFRFSVKKGNQ